MHIVVKDNTKKYPEDLSEFPTLMSIVELIGMYYPISEVHVTTDRNPDDISASVKFLYNDIKDYTIRWDGISIRIMRYVHKGNRLHFTMSANFPREFPFIQYMDVESCGHDYEKVFYSLVNGIHKETNKICLEIMRANNRFSENLPEMAKKVVKNFHHCEYC